MNPLSPRTAGQIALTLVAVACSGAPPAPVRHVEEPRPDPDRAMIARLNEQARAGAVRETLHGVTVDDPYRSLEQDSETTSLWIDGQTVRTQARLEDWTTEHMAERLDTLLSIGTVGASKVGGESVFYTKREGDREQPLLMIHDGEASRELLDPTTYGERAALDWFFPSPSGRYVTFGISQNGDERSTLRILRVADGEVLDDTIERCKWSSVEWLHSEDAFYYTRYPKPGEDGYDAENEDSYYPRVFYHRLGRNPDNDRLVFGAERGTDFPSVAISEDDRWLVVNVFRGWSESDVYLLDRGESQRGRVDAPDEAHRLVPVMAGEPHITTGQVHRGHLYLLTNAGTPRYRIDRVPVERASELGARRILVPEGTGTIEEWTLAGGKIVLHTIEDVQSKVQVHAMDGTLEATIPFDAPGEVETLDGAPELGRIVFGFSAYTVAPTLYSVDLATNEKTVLDRIETDIDLSRFTVTRERVQSPDGTSIPVTLVHGRTMTRDGQQPVLLYGYGGFNVSLLPSFTRNALYWIERGGVYAVANLRGGGEFGEQWHRAGNLGNKQRVFEDFEAVIRWLSSSRISNPDRIAITGGSNGGLLMGAMITRAPTSFRAAATYVGLYDMIRYHEFPPAELWISEYGSAEDPEQFRWLHAYSPYHHIEDGTPYPAVLVETADHDSRVYWGHSTKFAARLQEATSSDHPILFYMVQAVGHGAGTRRSDLVSRYVRQYAFLEHELGMQQ